MRRKKTQINKIRNKKGAITTNAKESQRIIRDYFENLYLNKLENLVYTDTFLDTYNYLKLNQEDINHLNRSITCNEIEVAIVFQKGKAKGLTNSLPNFTRPLKKN
jgi:hypothetical protein